MIKIIIVTKVVASSNLGEHFPFLFTYITDLGIKLTQTWFNTH
jgi:hypothetical protein